MGSTAGERVEHQRQRRHERLAFARLHLDDGTMDERNASQELHVVMPHAKPPTTGFTGGGKALDQQ